MTLAPEDLPPLHEALLEVEQLRALFHDLESHADEPEVRVQGQAGCRVGDDHPSLARALSDLENGSIAGVQIRYQFQDDLWCDTVQRLDEAYRLIRFRQPPMGE